MARATYRPLLAATAAVWLSAAARAGSLPAVTQAWARATAAGQTTGVVYMTLTDRAADRLISLGSPDASSAMLHRTTSLGGMAGMVPVGALDLTPGVPVALAPHGLHVMLSGLKHPLTAGGHVGLDLGFAGAGRMHVDVPILPIGAAGPQAEAGR